MPFLLSARVWHGLRAATRAVILASLPAMDASAQDRYAAERKAMLEDIASLTFQTRGETGREVLSTRVLEAIDRVPRHQLVPAAAVPQAYRNSPISIGLGQTISQPFIVALMTDLLNVKGGDKVLEIGTGSGYQAAVLAELGATVYTIEIVEQLGREAAQRLAGLGYGNVITRVGDGQRGWPQAAPFDSIIVTAASPEVPGSLTRQLKTGGRLVIPLGSQHGTQTLYLMEKQPDGTLTRSAILAVRFVPLTGSEKPAQ